MADRMWIMTVTQEEWTYLDRMVRNAAGVPGSLRFALDSATVAQEHMAAERDWREHNLVISHLRTRGPEDSGGCSCTPGDGCCPTDADIPTSADL